MDVHKAGPSIAGLWDLLQQAIQADDNLRIIDRCNDLLRVGGQEPHVLGLLGQSQLKMGFSEQAASNLQIASDALPERSELKTLLLQARVDIQDWQGVLEIFKSLESAMLEAMTGLKVMVNAGVALRRTGRLEQSVAQFRRCIDLIAQARLMKGSKEQKRKVIDLALIAATGGNDKVNLKNMMSRLFPILSESSLDVRIAPVVSMQEWCRGHGIPIKIVDPATEILASNSHRGGVIAAYLTDETWCVTLPHAEIVGGCVFVLSPDGFVLDGASYLPLENFFSFISIENFGQPWPLRQLLKMTVKSIAPIIIKPIFFLIDIFCSFLG
jgi:lipoprotein signal peptidase